MTQPMFLASDAKNYELWALIPHPMLTSLDATGGFLGSESPVLWENETL